MSDMLDIPAPIELRTNADWRWVLHLIQPEVGDTPAQPLDLTGAALTMHIRRRREEPAVYLTASTANGRIVVVDAAEGRIAMNVDAGEIRGRLGPGEFWCDLHVVIGEVDLVTFERAVTVVEGITR